MILRVVHLSVILFISASLGSEDLVSQCQSNYSYLQKQHLNLLKMYSDLRETVLETNLQISHCRRDSSDLMRALSDLLEKHSNLLVPAIPDRCPKSQNETEIILEIQVPGSVPFRVKCESFNIGSGWMAVYYKQNHLSLFNRTSAAYVRGIGNFESDVTDAFFIGLERLHLLTSGNPHEIMVYTGGKLERCDHFEVGNRSEGYVLKSVGECTGNSLSLRQGTKFSTYDQDEDGDPDHNLALDLAVGWWFRPGATSPDYNTFISMHIRRKD